MDERITHDAQVKFPDIDEDFHFLAYPAHILVWMSNPLGACTFVSPSWTTYTGRGHAEELVQGWLEHVHVDDRVDLLRGLVEAHGNRAPFRVMFRYLREDGVFRWFVGQGMPLTAAKGEFGGQLCLCFDVTPYQDGEAEMECSLKNMVALLTQTRLIAVLLDNQGRVQFSNSGLCRLLQCGGTELIDCKLFARHLASGDIGLLETLYPDGIQSAQFPAAFESELVAHDQQSRHVSWHAIVRREFSGKVNGTILIGDDVTTLREEEQQTSLYIKAIEATDNAIVVTDTQGNIISVNHAFSVLTGYSRADALGNNPRILQSGRHDAPFYQEMWSTLLTSGHWHGDVWDRHKDGSVYPKYLSISAIKSVSGTTSNYVGIFRDISERKTVEDRLDHLAHYDALTGAPNRCLLLDRLEQAIQRATRQGGQVGLLYIDLDHFKQVNDTFGHTAGDDLLKSAAQRMKTCVRAVDTVARLGGDEFVVLLADIGGADDARVVAGKLLEVLAPPYEVDGRQAVSTPSIGISIYPDDAATWKQLMKNADTAMYQAKQSGRNNFRLFQDLATPPMPDTD